MGSNPGVLKFFLLFSILRNVSLIQVSYGGATQLISPLKMLRREVN